jgi:hypothetical protein
LIVISGALVLVAAVLLVLGIVSSITLVYAAIGLSLVSAVFLLVGVFQRPPLTEGASPAGDEPARAVPVRMAKPQEPGPEPEAVHEEPVQAAADYDDQYDDCADVDAAADYPLEDANADFERRAEATGADVLVISGRPRYHLGGCEYVEGHHEAERLDIVEARELGFTPCGVCRPNETLALSAAGRAHAAPEPAPPAVTVPAAAAYAASAVQGNGASGDHAAPVTALPEAALAAPPVSEPVASVAPLALAQPPAAAASPAVSTPPPVAEPLAAPPAKKAAAPRRRAPRAKKPPAEPAAQTALTAETSAGQIAAPAAPAAPAPAARPRITARTVLAVATTKIYHRAGCDLLEGVEAEALTKGAAVRQGFLACGVCQP